jgi:Hint domain
MSDFRPDAIFPTGPGGCYLRGTRILTPTGEVFIETLKRDDSVVTRFGGIQRIKWIGRHSYRGAAVRNNRERVPVHLRAGSLGKGLPARDLYISPGHSNLLEGTLVLAKSLVNGITITQTECPERIDYFQIELEAHDCVIAEGTWSETYADWEGGRASSFQNAAEFEALYPEYRAPDTVNLCAPRPERGSGLDAALRPVVARASRDMAPGPLRGYIDCVRGEWKVDGWAHDSEHPELPVLLEILLEGQVIGTVLACDFREDLLKAGFGQGRCSFTFISPIKLRPVLLATLQVRRATDGALVPVSESILKAAIEPAIVKPRLSIVA